MQNQPNSELQHVGVKGMRWGFRKKPGGGYEESGRAKRGERSADSAEVAELRRHHVATLSNAEIRKINERLNLEQNYRNLERQSSVIGRGRQQVTSVLNDVGTLNRAVGIADTRAWGLGSQIVTGAIDKAKK